MVSIRYLISKAGGFVAQAVGRSPPTSWVPSSRLGDSMWVWWWTKRSQGRFFLEILPFSLATNFIHRFFTLIHLVSFHCIRPCDGASRVVGQHPCY